jgi:hypothetical protein
MSCARLWLRIIVSQAESRMVANLWVPDIWVISGGLRMGRSRQANRTILPAGTKRAGASGAGTERPPSCLLQDLYQLSARIR